MKKLFLLLLVIVLFSSCELSLTLKDEEGWELYQLGWSLNADDYMIQSHDGYLLSYEYAGATYEIVENEYIISGKSCSDIVVENPSNRNINVKVTHGYLSTWYAINAGDSLEIF